MNKLKRIFTNYKIWNTLIRYSNNKLKFVAYFIKSHCEDFLYYCIYYRLKYNIIILAPLIKLLKYCYKKNIYYAIWELVLLRLYNDKIIDSTF